MAFPRMTKLFDLARSVLPAARTDIHDLNAGAPANADPIPVAIPVDPIATETAMEDVLGTSREDMIATPPPETAPEEMPDIFGGAFDAADVIGSNDSFSFNNASDTPLRVDGVAPSSSSSAVPTGTPATFQFESLAQDEIIDFTQVGPDTVATTVLGATSDPGGPASGNEHSIPVHPVGCGCTDCCADDDEHHDDDHHGHDHPDQPVALASDGGDEPTPSEGGPTSGFSTSSVSTTGDNAIDSLLYGTRWGSGSGSTDMTFSFGTSSSVYISGYSEPTNGFGEFSEHQKTATRSALDYW